MERVVQEITIRNIGGDSERVMATIFGPWAVHQTANPSGEHVGWSITYIPLGFSVATRLSPLGNALERAEELYRRVPEYSSEHIELVRSIVNGLREATRVR